MMHHNIKFGYKKLNHLEDIIKNTFNEVLNLCCDNSKADFFHKTFQLVIMYHQKKFGSKYIRNSGDITESVIFFWRYNRISHIFLFKKNFSSVSLP